MEFLIGALVLGFSAVFIAPFILGAVSGIVPASLKGYFPTQSVTPALNLNSVIQTVVFGAVLMVVLLLMHKLGVGAGVRVKA